MTDDSRLERTDEKPDLIRVSWYPFREPCSPALNEGRAWRDMQYWQVGDEWGYRSAAEVMVVAARRRGEIVLCPDSIRRAAREGTDLSMYRELTRAEWYGLESEGAR